MHTWICNTLMCRVLTFQAHERKDIDSTKMLGVSLERCPGCTASSSERKDDDG